jgi:hypothetical protein
VILTINDNSADNCVIWNGIHCKTSSHGGIERHGYPDATYLDRVIAELASKGVTPPTTSPSSPSPSPSSSTSSTSSTSMALNMDTSTRGATGGVVPLVAASPPSASRANDHGVVPVDETPEAL